MFGSHHSAVNFLLLLAVADDAIGLGIIAVFYPDPGHPVDPVWLLLTLGGMAAAYGLRRMQVSLWPVYVLIGGGLSWSGLALSGVEPALALVVIVPFLPGPRLDAVLVGSRHEPHAEIQPTAEAGQYESHTISPLDQFEHQLKLTVDLGLFFFAFANAGVAFGSINSVTLIILLSLIVGKTIGISLFSWAGTRLGFPLPPDMGFPAPGGHRANRGAGADGGVVRRRKGVPRRLCVPRPCQDGSGAKRGRGHFGHWHWAGAQAPGLVPRNRIAAIAGGRMVYCPRRPSLQTPIYATLFA